MSNTATAPDITCIVRTEDNDITPEPKINITLKL